MKFNYLISKVFILVVAIAAITQTVHADIKVGLAVNSIAPEINAVNSQGEKVKLAQLGGTKGTLLLFFRSADWCPYCKKQLIEINQWHDKFASIGYAIAALSYDSVATLSQFKSQHAIRFTLLADQDLQTIKQYKVINQQYRPQDKHYGIPYPGVFILDKEQKITQKYFYEGYKNRVDFEQLYKFLKAQ
ncbi:peroxiredoxin family protein [Aliikangiella sp. IMCC44653]